MIAHINRYLSFFIGPMTPNVRVILFLDFHFFGELDHFIISENFDSAAENLKIDLRESLNWKISFAVFRASSIPLC